MKCADLKKESFSLKEWLEIWKKRKAKEREEWGEERQREGGERKKEK